MAIFSRSPGPDVHFQATLTIEARSREFPVRKRGQFAQALPTAMTDKAIRVTVLSLKPGFERILIPELTPIIEASRQIAGCLAFDLYRLSEERSTLVLHEIWKTHEALKAYALSPLQTEMTTLVARFLVRPMRAWEIEEVC